MEITPPQDVIEFLNAEYARRVRTNPRYSRRAFARFLKLSPGELSEILRRKRPITPKLILKVSRALGLSRGEVEHLLLSAQHDPSRSSVSSTNLVVPEEIFEVVSTWYHFAILNLMDCQDFSWDPRHISARLGISIGQSISAMQQLQRVGLVELEKKGSGPARRADHVFTLDQIPSQAIRSYHSQMLEKAKEALIFQSVNDRDISGISFTCRRRDIVYIKRDIAKFQDELAAKYEARPGEEVYHIEVALFRLTNERE